MPYACSINNTPYLNNDFGLRASGLSLILTYDARCTKPAISIFFPLFKLKPLACLSPSPFVNATNEMDSLDIEEKSEEYARFLKNVLQPNLEAALQKERQVQQEIREYEELSDKLRTGIPSQLPVDLGHGKIQCNATIEANQRVFVNVGMGFHVEFDAGEAVHFCNQRLSFLRGQVLPKRLKESETIRQHIRESEMILDAIALEIK